MHDEVVQQLIAGRRVVGVGIDLVHVAELVESVIERPAMLPRVFTATELADCDVPNRHERLAARFAAKEAAFKAVGCGWAQGVTWHDVVITRQPSGAPSLQARGELLVHARTRGGTNFEVSLSHSGGYATAVVLLLAD